MRHDYGELLPKTSRAHTIYFESRREPGVKAAERIGLVRHDALGLVPRLRRSAGRPPAGVGLGPAGAALRAGRLCRPAQRPSSREQGCARAATSTCISACARPAWRINGWSTAAPAISARSCRSRRPATVTAYRLPFWHYTTPLCDQTWPRRCGALGAAGDVPLPPEATGRGRRLAGMQQPLMQHLRFPQRKHGLSRGAQRLAGRGNGAAPAGRARRRPSPRPAARAARCRRTMCSRADVRRQTCEAVGVVRAGQGNARGLQLHVRAGARAAMSRLHPLPRCARRLGAAHPAAHQLRRRRQVAGLRACRPSPASAAGGICACCRPPATTTTATISAIRPPSARRCATSRSSSPARNGTCRS